VDADPKSESIFRRYAKDCFAELRLYGYRALHGIDDTWKLGKNAVTRGIGNSPSVVCNKTIHYLPMRHKVAKGTKLVDTYQAGITCNIGGKNRRKPTFNPVLACHLSPHQNQI
jgi:hypothetical protein